MSRYVHPSPSRTAVAPPTDELSPSRAICNRPYGVVADGCSPEGYHKHEDRGIMMTPDRRSFVQSMKHDSAMDVTGNSVQAMNPKFAYSFERPLTYNYQAQLETQREEESRSRDAVRHSHVAYGGSVFNSPAPAGSAPSQSPVQHASAFGSPRSVVAMSPDQRAAYAPLTSPTMSNPGMMSPGSPYGMRGPAAPPASPAGPVLATPRGSTAYGNGSPQFASPQSVYAGPAAPPATPYSPSAQARMAQQQTPMPAYVMR